MCIVTGPRIELAITLIDRMKGLFHEADSSLNLAQIVSFKTKETVIELPHTNYKQTRMIRRMIWYGHWKVADQLNLLNRTGIFFLKPAVNLIT